MSELTKNQLKTDNTNSFPNNNTGYITPSILRDFNVNMIDSLVDEVSYNVDSASFNQRISALDPSGSATAIAALEAATASLNTYTASNDVKWNTLGGKTGSYATTGSNTFDGVQTISTLTGTPLVVDHKNATTQNTFIGFQKSGSAKWNIGNIGSDDSFAVYNTNTFTSALTIDQSNNVVIQGNLTASLQSGYTWVGNGSGVSSQIPTSSISIDTSSFAKTNVNNTFTGTQTFNNVVVSGTASVQFLDVVYQSSSVVYSSGSNILGDAANDTQTLWGTVKLPSGPLSVTGSATVEGLASINNNILIEGNSNGSGSQYGSFNTILSTAETPTDVYGGYIISNTATDQLGAFVVNSYSAQYGGTPVPMLIGRGNNPDGSDTAIAFTSNGQADHWKKSNFKYGVDVTGSIGVTGNASVNGNTILGNATSDTTTINGSTTINGNGEATVALNIVSGSVEVVGPRGNGGHFYTNLPITSSEGRINGTFITKDLIVSGTWGGAGSGSLTVERNATISGSLTVLGGITGSISINTGSFATTGSNNFTGNQNIYTDGASLTLAKNSDGSGSAYSGVVVKVDTTTDPTNVYSQLGLSNEANQSFALSLNSYSSAYPGETIPTLIGYFTGSESGNDVAVAFPSNGIIDFVRKSKFTYGASITGSLIATGSAVITGSVNGNVNALSISSNTASLNLNNGNFFTLQLVAGTNTRIEPSNIKPGQTINIRIATTGSATVSFPSSVKQVSGSSYVPSTITATDIITLVSFDNSALYLANVKNLI